ncbi:unnamed protein product [Closterium sp. NIES-53]
MTKERMGKEGKERRRIERNGRNRSPEAQHLFLVVIIVASPYVLTGGRGKRGRREGGEREEREEENEREEREEERKERNSRRRGKRGTRGHGRRRRRKKRKRRNIFFSPKKGEQGRRGSEGAR